MITPKDTGSSGLYERNMTSISHNAAKSHLKTRKQSTLRPVLFREVKSIMRSGLAGCKLSGDDPFFEKSKWGRSHRNHSWTQYILWIKSYVVGSDKTSLLMTPYALYIHLHSQLCHSQSFWSLLNFLKFILLNHQVFSSFWNVRWFFF